MALIAGTRLGPYEIAAPIGAGGMGEVYRARDTRLGRDVALKILPAEATDADRLRRFEQEARATAALNHPNILAVFDVGADGGVSFVVSELLEGETLRDRLKSGSLPPRKATEWAGQLARGLAAAHDKGIVHRDLKPENVFVTRDARIKILDFGIAKLMAGPVDSQTMAPTIEAGTTPGVVLGTIGYMAPEQVRGVPADHRADIFSFGAILYEMLSARRAFAGTTQADTMSAILTADPAEFGSGTQVPPAIDRVVRRCLEKSPEERFQSARDVAFAIDALGATTSGSGAPAALDAPAARRPPGRAWVAAALILGLAAGSAATWLAATRLSRSEPATYRQVTFRRGTITSARFSPDGETIVYSSGWEGKPQELYTTRVGTIGERPLGIQGELLAISSAGELALLLDVKVLGNWMQTGTLARAPLGGGAPREVLRDVGGADWSSDGQQFVITRFLPDTRRWRLEYPVGKVVYETDKWIERPRLSRDGTRVLLLEHPISGDNRGVVITVSLTGERTVLSPEYPSLVGSAWSPSGDEAWYTASAAGMRLDLFGARPGQPVRLVSPSPASLVVEDSRPDGRVILQTTSLKARMLVKTPSDTEERDLSWFDYPILRDMSADGRLILFDEEGEGGGPSYSVFVRKTDGSPAVRIGDGYAGRLSPDGQAATTGRPNSPPNTLTITPIGPGEPRVLTLPLLGIGSLGTRWFPDGRRLILAGRAEGRPFRTYEYTLESGALRPLTPEGTVGTLLSPDGRLFVTADAEGRRQLWPTDGGQPIDIRGLAADDAVAGWAAGSQALFVSAPRTGRTRDLARLDLATGRRQAITVFGPSDATGVRSITVPLVSHDGRTYAYRYTQLLSDLYVGSGLR